MRQMFDEKQIRNLIREYFSQLVLVYETDNIQSLGDELCEKLRTGDIVRKITGKQKHAYIVSYKGDGAGEGMCLTYTDASLVETVSYDYIDGHWVYNSTDITHLGE